MIDFGMILPSRSNRFACGNSQPRDTPSAFAAWLMLMQVVSASISVSSLQWIGAFMAG